MVRLAASPTVQLYFGNVAAAHCQPLAPVTYSKSAEFVAQQCAVLASLPARQPTSQLRTQHEACSTLGRVEHLEIEGHVAMEMEMEIDDGAGEELGSDAESHTY